jgi:hypothetical protein
MIGSEVVEGFHFAGGPMNLNLVDFCRASQTEVQAEIVL